MTTTETHDATTTPAETSPAPPTRPVRRPPAEGTRLGTRIGWAWILLSSLGIAAFAVVPYLTSSLPVLAESGAGGLADHYAGQPPFVLVAFYVHIVAGGTALVASPFQFWRGLRDRAPRVHRWTGRVALVAIGIAGLAGLALAPFSAAGLVGTFGFGALAVLWLLAGWRGYRAIRHGDVPSHRAWMMRAFALTYAAVTLRLWLPLLMFAQVPFAGPAGFDADAAFANAYAAVPFLCWLPNLLVAEWLIRRRGLPSYRLATPPLAG
ncbi:DUF2306 domain-containing protein [Agromyces bracchium]|uniref:DUF2306 domain-containing protein n=1 Tax=Agromyces bracchium TaxID=88376 RepID=A0A6I3MHS9_9MICO|nr:DUF2306 domain-containing protein [Agromyces bracchium]MTH69873.1 DUF2306 domain-containing protein [Agromyces bracchium]